jgi:hypothetical protein
VPSSLCCVVGCHILTRDLMVGSWLKPPGRGGEREERGVGGATTCAFFGERHRGGDIMRSPEKSERFGKSSKRSALRGGC